jgi:hypothetical protein
VECGRQPRSQVAAKPAGAPPALPSA